MTMKRFFSAALLAAITTAGLSAVAMKHTAEAASGSTTHMMMHPEEMVQVLESVKGKTVEEPKELLRSWIDFKVRAFRMAAEAMDDFADQIKNHRDRRKYEDVARLYKRLAHRLERLPIPQQKMIKHFKNVDVWLALKAEKADLVAQEMRSIGKQLNNEKMIEKSQEVEQWAKTLKSSIHEDADTEEDMEESDVE